MEITKRQFFLSLFLMLNAPLWPGEEITDSNISDLIAKHQITAEIGYQKLQDIIAHDVLSYYDLLDTYDTELKVKVFKKSNQYNLLMADIKAQEAKIPEMEFVSYARGISEYDLKIQAFHVLMDTRCNPVTEFIVEKKGFHGWTREKQTGSDRVRCNGLAEYFPSASDGFLFSQLGMKRNKAFESDKYDDGTQRTDSFILKVPEESALKIEKERSSVKIKITFIIKGIVKKHVKYDRTVLRSLPEYHHIKFSLFDAVIKNISIVNERDEILFSKDY